MWFGGFRRNSLRTCGIFYFLLTKVVPTGSSMNIIEGVPK